jgi:predicted DNA-binding transcriptional regulator AlpA
MRIHVSMLIYVMLSLSNERGLRMEHDDTLLVDGREAARLLGVGRSTLAEWERDGHGPQPIHVGRPGAKRRTIRYSVESLRDFARGNRG